MVGHWWLVNKEHAIMMNDADGWWMMEMMMDHGDIWRWRREQNWEIEKHMLDMGWDPSGRLCFAWSFWPCTTCKGVPISNGAVNDVLSTQRPAGLQSLAGWGFGSAQHLKSRYGSGAATGWRIFSSMTDYEGLNVVVFIFVDPVEHLELILQ